MTKVIISCLFCNKFLEGEATEIQELLKKKGWKEVKIDLGNKKIWGYACPECYKKLLQ